MDDRVRYLWLKLLTIVGPTLFVALGEIFRHEFLKVHFRSATVSVIMVGSTLVGAIIFSWYVFRVIERVEAERRTYKDAVLSMQERERIAREMHDGIAQNLAVLKLDAYKIKESLGRSADADSLRSEVTHLEALVDQTFLEVRQTLYDLRASRRLHEGFWPTIERQIAEFERHTGIHVSFKPLYPARELWNELASVQILRIIQEALANVRQHAEAQAVDLAAHVDSGRVRFMIRDDGKGFDMANTGVQVEHYGLSVMKERAEAIGGRLRVASQPGGGTTVSLEIPVDRRGLDRAKSKIDDRG